MIPMLLIAASTAMFLITERLFPGRELPNSRGWYGRALLINAFQLATIFIAGMTWNRWLHEIHLIRLAATFPPVAQAFFGWFVGTFIFYWWHRIRHLDGFWVLFHQVHHSPSRIEAITSFYKHPIEIVADSILSSLIMFGLLGASLEGAAWFNFFAATGEYFYHSNLRAPRWLGYIIQTPQLHSIHHQLDVHNFNFGDLPIWDKLFGTYRRADDFAERCGFPAENERKLAEMLVFRDVYHS